MSNKFSKIGTLHNKAEQSLTFLIEGENSMKMCEKG